MLVPAWRAYLTILTYPSSPDCRLDIGHLSPLLVGGNRDPSPVFTTESPACRIKLWILSTEPGCRSRCPALYPQRPDRIHCTFILSRHSTSHRHASKARCFYGRSNTRSTMTRLQQKRITWIMLANIYNSELAELFLRFRRRTRFLWTGPPRQACWRSLFRSSSSMNVHRPL